MLLPAKWRAKEALGIVPLAWALIPTSLPAHSMTSVNAIDETTDAPHGDHSEPIIRHEEQEGPQRRVPPAEAGPVLIGVTYRALGRPQGSWETADTYINACSRCGTASAT
jgi:hypothetical protein